ncbi:MAG: MMPL family transporter [Nanobdellota archaeon]
MNIFEKTGEKLARVQEKKPKLFILLMLLLIIGSLPGLPLLLDNIEPSLEKILPQKVPEVETMNDMRDKFGADMMYIIISTEGPSYDILNPEVIKYMDLLANRLKDKEYILQVNSISEIIKASNKGEIPLSVEKIKNIVRQTPQSSQFINNDRTLGILQIRSDTGAESEIISHTMEEIESEISATENSNPGVNVKITGFNAIDKATFDIIIKDFAKITGISFVSMFLFLFIYFRNWKKVFSSISVIIMSVIMTLGITGYIGLTITVVTMVAAAMIMALGISYGINVIHEYYAIKKEIGKKNVLENLNKNIIRALIGSSLTTSAGFLALLFGIIPAMKNLGIVLALGIIITLMVSIFILPVIIYSLDKEVI